MIWEYPDEWRESDVNADQIVAFMDGGKIMPTGWQRQFCEEGMILRKATREDIPAIKRIADANKETLGFVMRGALLEAIGQGGLLVAESLSHIAGFARYHHRRDQQTTVYEICVAEGYRSRGVGKGMIDSIQDESRERGKSCIQLKAMVGIAANTFYEKYGFSLVGVEAGRKRPLNIWRLPCT